MRRLVPLVLIAVVTACDGTNTPITAPADAATSPAFTISAAKPGSSGPTLVWSPTTSTNPATYDYGTVVLGQSSAATFTLTDLIHQPAGTIAISLTNSSGFTITSDGCSGTRLGPKNPCTVTVQYTPTVDGQTDAATLVATGQHASANLALQGKGGVVDLVVSPGDLTTTVSGGAQDGMKVYLYSTGETLAQGQTSTSYTFTITNQGTASSEPLANNDIGAGAFVLTNDHCSGATLAPGDSCTFDAAITGYVSTCADENAGTQYLAADGSPYYDQLNLEAYCP